MSVSVVDLCNQALDLIRTAPITSLDDNSETARRCKRHWPSVRDSELARYPWNGAVARASLAAEGSAPLYGFAHQYPLPEGPEPRYCLRVLSVGDPDADIRFTVEGRRLLTDAAAPLPIEYIGRVEDPTTLDPNLIEVLVLAMAVRLVARATESSQARKELQDDLSDTRKVAMRADARTQSLPTWTHTGWLEARR